MYSPLLYKYEKKIYKSLMKLSEILLYFLIQSVKWGLHHLKPESPHHVLGEFYQMEHDRIGWERYLDGLVLSTRVRKCLVGEWQSDFVFLSP